MGAESILKNDPYGLYVALISVTVVLSALIVLFFLIWGFGRLMVRSAAAPRKEGKVSMSSMLKKEDGVNAELIAAIGLALKLDGVERHDKESEVITLNKVARVYSPWSSKIHGLTHEPSRR